MAARSKARKRAVDVLYESDVRGADPVTTLAERLSQADPPIPEYAVDLVEGVTGNLALIDETLSEHSEGWTVERMPAVDRAVLRLALYELLVRDDIPDAVVIDEAVELAKSLSTDESPRFVNGILGRVLRERLAAPPAPEPLPPAPAEQPG
ncbi:MAG TPA: transcription antitermination factor NusB [Mycobacteriales bacterium]|jgi:N utilization substance protein B|nr:transcription antitermination factor NusB [Mycobacteriales bacterium]